jgi:hypothetical protein
MAPPTAFNGVHSALSERARKLVASTVVKVGRNPRYAQNPPSQGQDVKWPDFANWAEPRPRTALHMHESGRLFSREQVRGQI